MEFPKRPRSHELEEVSERFFRQQMPQAWVAEKIAPDYGADLRVDIFENGMATGRELLVQLKSSDTASAGEAELVTLRVATYNLLWDKLQVVLLVKYVASEDEAYYLKLVDVPRPPQDQETFTVHIPKTNRLSTAPWQEIRDHIFQVTDRKLIAGRSNQVSSGFVGINYASVTDAGTKGNG